MVIIIKAIIKIFLIFILFLTYDIDSIDSNSDKITLIDRVNIHDENTFNIYFKNIINSYNLDNLLNKYNIKINSYIIDDKKYYAKDTYDLIKEYTKDMSLEEKIYYEINGINIEGLNITCENGELMKFSLVEKIY